MNKTPQTVAFQGELGAYSHQACLELFPEATPLACTTFETAIENVRSHKADYAVLPVENSIYGRVADLHHLLPDSGLYIIAEYFLPIRLNLLGLPGVTLTQIQEAQSHTVALGQCRAFLRQNNIRAVTGGDTAGAAKALAHDKIKHRAAIASKLAGEIYGLQNLHENIEDADHNTTRFLVMGREPATPPVDNGLVMTSFVFRVRNVPAALYKTMGGFATNSVNMVKLESYMLSGSFNATQFYADIEGHPEAENVRLAFEELHFFTDYVKILGVYPAHERRMTAHS